VAVAGIELHEVEFVREYWHDVFESFVEDCAAGLTPNPDLSCNRHIKFRALLHHTRSLGARFLATGHYARICRRCDLSASPRPGRVCELTTGMGIDSRSPLSSVR